MIPPKKKPISFQFKTDDGQLYEVPVEGSLGLLANGYQGLVAWRAKRKNLNYSFEQHLIPPTPQKDENAK